MAESTASITNLDLKKQAGYYLGYGRDNTAWSAAQAAHLVDVVKRCKRQVEAPPPLPGRRLGHEWSWLRPSRTLSLNAPYTTGTVAVTEGDATVTLTSGTFPTWAADGKISVSGASPIGVSTRTDGTHLEMDVVWPDATATLQTYEVFQDDYTLPDNVQRIEGPLTYAPGAGRCEVDLVPEAAIRLRRQNGTYMTGPPRLAATRPTTTAFTGQRAEIMLYPAPDDDYILTYTYVIIPDAFSADADYPLGGMFCSELYIESALAIAEADHPLAGQPIDTHRVRFFERLAAAVAVDGRYSSPSVLGYNGDRSDSIGYRLPRYESDNFSGIVTQNGQYSD